MRSLLVIGALCLVGLIYCGPGQNCVPGKSEACACPGGAPGAQACKADGSGWETCVCPDVGKDGGNASEGSGKEAIHEKFFSEMPERDEKSSDAAVTELVAVGERSAEGPSDAVGCAKDCSDVLTVSGRNAKIELGDVSTDSKGNIYITGSVTIETTGADVVEFGNIMKTFSGKYNGFVAKMDSSFNFTQVDTVRGSGVLSLSGIATKADGSAFIVGYYRDEAIFGSVKLPKASTSNGDLFVAKVGANGGFDWVKTATGTITGSRGQAIQNGPGKDLYIYGFCDRETTFGKVSLKLKQANGTPCIIKLDTSGSFLWARGLPYRLRNNVMAVDSKGGVVVGGTFGDRGSRPFSVEIDGDTYSTTETGSSDILLVRFEPSTGLKKWVLVAGGNMSDNLHGLAIDSQDNIFVYGGFASVMMWDKTQLIDKNGSFFVAKMSLDGATTWIKGSDGNGILTDLFFAKGRVFAYGRAGDDLQFGNTVIKGSRTNSNPFILRIDPKNGSFVSARTVERVTYVKSHWLSTDQIMFSGTLKRKQSLGGVNVAPRGLSDIFFWLLKGSWLP